MYFSNIEIQNYGCISKLNYKFRFNDNGDPIPCVLIGENGKGKTLFLTNLVDLLVETKRTVYGNNLSETAENKYYKIGTTSYIKNNTSYSRVKVQCIYKDKNSTLIDIMSHNPKIDINHIDQNELLDLTNFKENGYSKKIESNFDKKCFNDFVLLYFPGDRYYYPMWFNDSNRSQSRQDLITDINTPKSNFIKTDVYSSVKDWLIDIYLERVTQKLTLTDHENFPEHLKGRTIDVLMETPMQSVINKIYSVIKGEAINAAQNFNRKRKLLGFSSGNSSCEDISQLSEGEMNLFCLALNIIREWDINHNDILNLEEIAGCVLIDEVDSGLHIDYAYRALPELMKLFPKVQFIFTSHSPFFLAGLIKEYSDNVDILNMPEGIKLTNVNTFSEMKKAQDLFNDTVEELRENHDKLVKQIEELEKTSGKIYVYTEGKTDVILLNKAIEKLNICDLDLEIKTAFTNKNKNSDSVVKNLLELLQANKNINKNIVIGIFDRDANPAIKFKDKNGNEIVLNEQEFVCLDDNIYAFSLPVPHCRVESDQISIEHYFKDDEIKTYSSDGKRLFMGNEFYDTGFFKDESMDYCYKYIGNLVDTIKIIEHQSGKIVTDRKGKGDYSLSKAIFANNVSNDIEGFDSFDFSEFNKIFDIIRKILQSR